MISEPSPSLYPTSNSQKMCKESDKYSFHKCWQNLRKRSMKNPLINTEFKMRRVDRLSRRKLHTILKLIKWRIKSERWYSDIKHRMKFRFILRKLSLHPYKILKKLKVILEAKLERNMYIHRILMTIKWLARILPASKKIVKTH